MTPPLPSLSDKLAPLTEALDALSHDARVNWMRGLGKRELRALYELASQGAPLTVEHFIRGEGEVVIHHGKNSLLAFTGFQKRIVRRGAVVQGFNFQSMSAITGPGHFTVHQDGDEVLFDYIQVPADAPAEFPPVQPNDKGLSTLVYGGMIDRNRRVSAHCVIGSAYRGGKSQGAWYMLTREDAGG